MSKTGFRRKNVKKTLRSQGNVKKTCDAEMQVELFFKCFVVHFALSHAVLLIFHFTVGMKKIMPLIRSRLENVSFQYAYLLPHDFVFTFMFIFFIDVKEFDSLAYFPMNLIGFK